MSNKYQGTYIVIGPPGTGKTTDLSRQVRAIVEELGAPLEGSGRSPVLVASLTKTAALEVGGRGLPIPREAIGTLHALAFRSLGRPRVITSELVCDFSHRHEAFELSAGAVKAGDDLSVDLMRSEAPGDSLSEKYHLLRARMIPRDDWPLDVLEFADAWEEWKTSADAYDFTDLIESALTTRTPPPFSPRVVIIDEAQDLSALEISLAKFWGDCAGALILSGDPHQSLYSWRGAHPELLEDPSVPESHRRTLRRSWRVPAKVQRLAMKWIEDLTTGTDYEYRPRVTESGEVVEGLVSSIAGNWRTPEEVILEATESVKQGRSAMICATCSYLLQPTIATLKGWGIPFSNPWRTNRGDWNPLGTRGVSMLDRIRSFFAPIARPKGELWSWSEAYAWSSVIAASGIVRRGKKAELEKLSKSKGKFQPMTTIDLGQIFDRSALEEIDGVLTRDTIADAVEAGIDWMGSRLLQRYRRSFEYAELVARREDDILGEPKKPRLYIGTVHSFKGGEADDVYIFPDITAKASQAWHSGEPEEREPILRTFYVALTRARRSVSIANGGGGNAVDLKRVMLRMGADDE